MRLRAKVCGLTNAGDAAAARAAGADWLGFVRHASSPRHCADLVAASAGAGERGVLVVVGDGAEAMIAEARSGRLKWVQPYVSAPLRCGVVSALRSAGLCVMLPWPDRADQPRIEAELYVWETDAAATGVHGGSGISHAACHPPPGPFLLAGGLCGDVLAARLRALPSSSRALLHGVDAASRLESAPGHKSIPAIVQFVSAAHDFTF